MQHSDMTKIMIISTQTPNDKSTNGMTGRIIQKLTEGGFVFMHRDMRLHHNRGVNELAEFQQHLASNGWLIITGHGGGGAIGGQYTLSDGVMVDIECCAEDYVKLLDQSQVLRADDHLNILLYVCHGAEVINDRCLARELAQHLSSRGISTTILASTDKVYRISSYEKKFGDVPDEKLKVRTPVTAIRMFTTQAGSENFPQVTDEVAPNQEIEITKGGVKLIVDPKNILLFNAIKRLNFGIKDSVIMHDLMLSHDEAAELVLYENDRIIFRKSSEDGFISATIYKKRMHHAEHYRFEYITDSDGNFHINMSLPVKEDFIQRMQSMPEELMEAPLPERDKSEEAPDSHEPQIKKQRSWHIFNLWNEGDVSQENDGSESIWNWFKRK